MKLGKIVGFTWYVIMQPVWNSTQRIAQVIDKVDEFGDKHIPGFNEGSQKGYDFLGPFAERKEKLHE